MSQEGKGNQGVTGSAGHSGGLRPEPVPVSAVPAPAVNAEEASRERLTQTLARVLAESDGLRRNAPADSYQPWVRHARTAVLFFEGYYENEIDLLREKLSDALAAGGNHRSDCAVFNAPAYEPGPCDCAALSRARGE